MKRVLVTYGDEKYDKAKRMLVSTAKKIKYFDQIFDFSPSDIDSEFKKEYAQILNIKRGNGLWLWKPYFISTVLNKLNEGDILFYCDSGAIFLRNPIALENEFQSIFVSEIPLIEKQFTKDSVFSTLNCSDEIKNSNQIIATYLIIKKNSESLRIINEWFDLCKKIELLSPSNQKEKEYFISHREDQSLLSVICKINNIHVFYDITQRNNLPYTYWNDKYLFNISQSNLKKRKPIIFLHKIASPNWLKLILLWLRQIFDNYYIKYFKINRKKR